MTDPAVEPSPRASASLRIRRAAIRRLLRRVPVRNRGAAPMPARPILPSARTRRRAGDGPSARCGWRSWSLAVLAGAGLFLSGFSLGARTAATPGTPAAGAELFAPFWDVYDSITKSYVGAVDRQKLVQGAINGMIGSLNDPFSAYMSPDELKRARGFDRRRVLRDRGDGDDACLQRHPGVPDHRAGVPPGRRLDRWTARRRSARACGRTTGSPPSTARRWTALRSTRRSAGSAARRARSVVLTVGARRGCAVRRVDRP